jgi:vacuolar-type H+-ATPase subunit B/Vma2
VHQGAARRPIAMTLERGWRLLDALPPEDLLRLGSALLATRESARKASVQAGDAR